VADASNLIAQIDRATRRIADVFAQQCEHGAQTRTLPADMAACGQFIGDDALRIEQHGLHGIAAALRVLGAQSTDESRQLVGRLVAYTEACFGIPPTVKPPSDRRLSDTDNVIKIGELLYGLSFVSAAHADRNRLTRHLAEQLQRSLIDGRGWGYFIGDADVQLLPTAYALRGLAQHNYDVSSPKKFVLDSLQERQRTSGSTPADLTTTVACAYCLTFSSAAHLNEDIISRTFHSAWRALEPLFDEDVEQNLEYWRGRETHYVRVPWQLYLLALASEHSFLRFASFRAQRRLHAILNALQEARFRYPHSGRYMSSRTHAIAFDVLKAIRERAKRMTMLRLAYGVDRIRVLAGAKAVRYVAAAVALGLMVYSTYQWMQTGRVSELAPNFLASLLALILASARREP
jgi:hypothetical protein